MSQSSNKHLDMLTKLDQTTKNSPKFLSHDQRQAALASLFSSLSNLASQQQQANGIDQNLLQMAQQTVSQPLGSPASHSQDPTRMDLNSMTLTNSIQSVVAAAMMQQHLANINQLQQQQQQQQSKSSTPTTSTITTPSTAAKVATNTTTNPMFFKEQTNSSFEFNNGLSFHQDPVQSSIGFGQPPATFDQQQQPQQHHHQQQQQRINYCTICNKELCNKYFMKTHMLKMHGINLEMEPAAEDSAGENSSSRAADATADDEDLEKIQSSSLDLDSSWSTEDDNGNNKAAQDLARNRAKQQQQLSVTKQNMAAGGQNFICKKPINNSKQTTSVMNGFAGNSMGGVVCDICNKELCSKYFLKVHKQNTHGIMTDYQDASQFVYPFPNPLAAAAAAAAANPFLATAPPASMGGPAPPTIENSFPPNPLAFFKQNSSNNNDCQRDDDADAHYRKPKRARMAQEAQNESFSNNNIANNPNNSPNLGEDLDGAYRLMAAQRQQQQQSHVGMSQPMLPFDTMAPNPMMMCFGAMGPFGPAGMSPAMIVDHILRNQHLFNRNNVPATQISDPKKAAAATNKSGKNNAAKASLTPDNGKQSKNPNTKDVGGKNTDNNNSNNRYLTHYTEACPMCDRRFKSIKWLKTHMMNDHKQEIGAYMQMMMQYMYDTNKANQQAAAVASMASIFEQQQRNFHQSPQLQQQQYQPPPPPPPPVAQPITPIATSQQLRFQLPNETQQNQQQKPTSDFLTKLLNATALQQQNKLDEMKFNQNKLFEQTKTSQARTNLSPPTKRDETDDDDEDHDDDDRSFHAENLIVGVKSKQSVERHRITALDDNTLGREFAERQQDLAEGTDDYEDQLDLSLSFRIDRCNSNNNNNNNNDLSNASNDTTNDHYDFDLLKKRLQNESLLLVADGEETGESTIEEDDKKRKSEVYGGDEGRRDDVAEDECDFNCDTESSQIESHHSITKQKQASQYLQRVGTSTD